jgi:hypothetical protein
VPGGKRRFVDVVKDVFFYSNNFLNIKQRSSSHSRNSASERNRFFEFCREVTEVFFLSVFVTLFGLPMDFGGNGNGLIDPIHIGNLTR